MWLYIIVYAHAIMIMWVMRFSIITSAEPFSATQCTAVRPLPSFWVRASSLLSSGRQLRSSFIVYDTWRQLYHYNISFILIFYMCLYINVYADAIMIMRVMRFSIITSAEPLSATQCTAVRPEKSFSVRASTLLSSGRQLRSSFIPYNTWRQLYHYNISFILIFYMWLYINVYADAIMIMWVMRFSIITSAEPLSATLCTAVLPSLFLSIRASTLLSSGR